MKKYQKAIWGSFIISVVASNLSFVSNAETNHNITEKYLLGHINKPSKDARFSKVNTKYSRGKSLYMHNEAYKAFEKMHYAAKKDGVNLFIVSALRTFQHQKNIWDRKWLGKRKVDGRNLAVAEPNRFARALLILRFSAMPGTSRHHWGTDIDLNALENEYFDTPKGKKVYSWLKANGPRFGFQQVYTEKGKLRPRGYNEEKWHWSYLPVAKIYLKNYSKKITYSMLNGFEGSDVAARLKVIPSYVFSINPECY